MVRPLRQLVGTQRLQGTTLDVALVIPLHGSAGLFGPSCELCAQLAAEELNATGGVLARELGRLGGLRGAGLKAVEDLADAHVCAYVGLWWWTHGPAATLVAGDDGTGAILVPRPPG